MISDNIELEYVYHICGEHWGCQRVDVMKQFPFPEIKGSFYNENYLWFSFAINGYKVACYNLSLIHILLADIADILYSIIVLPCISSNGFCNQSFD